jgi:hypothetical protein
MANLFYNEAKESIVDRNIDLLSDTIKAMMVKSGYVANADHQFIDEGGANDAVDHRVTGTTDQTLGSKAIGKDNTGDFAYFDAADSVFSAVPGGETAVAVVIYKDTGTPTTSKLICYLDIPDTPTNGGDITLQYATPANGGIFKLA